LLGYPLLVVLFGGILPWKLPGEVGSQQFVSYVEVPSVVDFFEETMH
jgi:hypothetical protein